MSGGKIIGDNRPKRILEMGPEEKGRISLFSLGVYYRKSLFNAIKGILSPDKVVPDQRVPVIFLSNNDKVFEEKTTFRESRDGVTQDYSYDILCICTITEDGRRQYIIDMSEYDHYFVPEYSKADLKKRGRYMKLTSEGERIVSGVPESVVMKNKIINAVRKFCIYIMNGGEYTDKDIQNAISMTCDLIFGEEYNEEELIRLLYDGVKNILNIDLDDETDRYNEEVGEVIQYIRESIKEIKELREKYHKINKGSEGIQKDGEGKELKKVIESSVYKICEKIMKEIGTEKVRNEASQLIDYIYGNSDREGLKVMILELNAKYNKESGDTQTLDSDIGRMIDELFALCDDFSHNTAHGEINVLYESLQESITLLYMQNNIINDTKLNAAMSYIRDEEYSRQGLIDLLKTDIPALNENGDIAQSILENYELLYIQGLLGQLKSILSDKVEIRDFSKADTTNYEMAGKITKELDLLGRRLIYDDKEISVQRRSVEEKA